MSKKKREEKKQQKEKLAELDKSEKVLMRFKEDKFYNDLNTPIFKSGEVYEMEGSSWIQRWVKRGGEIVEGTIPMPEQKPADPSFLVGQEKPEVEVPEEKEENFSDEILDFEE